MAGVVLFCLISFPPYGLKAQKLLAQGNTLGISAISHIVVALFYG
jgi:hypothetical protein